MRIFSWVSTHCTAVPASEWSSTTGSMENQTGAYSMAMPGMTGTTGEAQSMLYDCLGTA